LWVVSRWVGEKKATELTMNWNPTENCFLTTYHSSFTVTGGCWFTVAIPSPLWNVNKDIASTNVKTGIFGDGVATFMPTGYSFQSFWK